MENQFAKLQPILLSDTKTADEAKKYYSENNIPIDNLFMSKFINQTSSQISSNKTPPKQDIDILGLLHSTFTETEYDTPVEATDNKSYKLPTEVVNQKAKRALSYFIGKGYTKEQASGIVGNLYAESGLNHMRPQNNGGPGFGYAQWEHPRQGTFKTIIGKDITKSTEKDQLDFINWELNNTEKRAKEELLKTNNASDAAKTFATKFERMKKYNKEREIYANHFYKLV